MEGLLMKTKLGISVGLLGALVYLGGLFSGYTVLVLVAAYILLCEENAWLKQAAVKAIVINIVFSVLSALIGYIPSAIGVIDDFLRIFNSYLYIEVVTEIVNFIRSVLSIVESVLLLVLGLKALHQGTVAVKPIDKLVAQHMKAE